MRGSWVTKMKILRWRAQQLERARAVDAGVLDLVEQHDRRVADDGRVGDQERAGLSARQLGHPARQRDRLAGELVGEAEGLRDRGLDLAAEVRRMRAWVCRNSSTGRSERNVVCCVMSAIGLRAGSSRYSSGGRRPSIRMRRPVGVSRVGEQLDIVDQRRLARSGGVDDADDVAHAQVEPIDRVRNAVASMPAND